MSDIISQILGKPQKKSDENLTQSLFYFLRECHINPLDEEYLIYDKENKLVFKMIKRGITPSLFNKLMEERYEHYKKENEIYKKGFRRR